MQTHFSSTFRKEDLSVVTRSTTENTFKDIYFTVYGNHFSTTQGALHLSVLNTLTNLGATEMRSRSNICSLRYFPIYKQYFDDRNPVLRLNLYNKVKSITIEAFFWKIWVLLCQKSVAVDGHLSKTKLILPSYIYSDEQSLAVCPFGPRCFHKMNSVVFSHFSARRTQRLTRTF